MEFWLLGASPEATRQLFDAFGRDSHGVAARFAVADLADPASVNFTTGLLREAACDLVIVDASMDKLAPAAWGVLRRLLIPGGLALIRRTVDWLTPAGAGWSPVAADVDGAELWAAPPELSDRPAESDVRDEPDAPRWLIACRNHEISGMSWRASARHAASQQEPSAAGSGQLIDTTLADTTLADTAPTDTAPTDTGAWWMAPGAVRVDGVVRIDSESLDPAWLWSAVAQEEMRALRAADFFCDEPDEGPDDRADGAPTGAANGAVPGERVLSRVLDFLHALLAARAGAATRTGSAFGTEAATGATGGPCRVTVVTRRAVMDVASPWAATLWGAVRALGLELDSGIDLRLVDIGAPADLRTVSWLARHDVRERELAVRDGRLYAPQLVPLPGGGPLPGNDEATAPAAEAGP